MIGQPVLREVVGADAFGAIAAADLQATVLGPAGRSAGTGGGQQA